MCPQVFLDFISYSSGPLPEDLLKIIKVPVVIGWGDQDPWEPIELGRAYADFDSVEVHTHKRALLYCQYVRLFRTEVSSLVLIGGYKRRIYIYICRHDLLSVVCGSFCPPNQFRVFLFVRKRFQVKRVQQCRTARTSATLPFTS